MSSVNDESNESLSMPIASSSHTPHGMSGRLSTTQDVKGDKGGERPDGNAEEQITPRKSTPSRGGLLSPFDTSYASHLPTPQSPSNTGTFNVAIAQTPESPLAQNSQSQRPSAAQYLSSQPTVPEDYTAVSQSFMTPESSPVFHRKAARSPEPTAAEDTAALTLSSPFTPRPRSQAELKTDVVIQPTFTPRTLSPPLSRDITPSSRLSSPFQLDRLTLADRSRSRTKTPARSYVTSPSNRGTPPPIAVSDALSPEPSTSKTPPPLPAPIPQRAVGGEIERIRLQIVADEAAHVRDMEVRRPYYLVREKRQNPGLDLPDGEVLDLDDQDTALPGVGVTETPIKGRRIQLFQETSEESFEQSLLAGGYPGYGSTTASEPQTPVNKGKSALSQRALQWLQQATPGQPSPVNMAPETDIDWVPSEKELRKRKRLAAFQDHTETSEPPAKLHTVVLEGRGRVLSDMLPEEMPAVLETPNKKRSNNRRKKRGGLPSSASRRGYLDQQPDETEIQGPNWLDSAFPWCMRSQERTEMARMEQEERLRWIERYLERDSGSEEEDIVEDQTLQPSARSGDDDEPLVRRGRGKMVPLKTDPRVRRGSPDNNRVLLPSDPADARAALLSKKSVRTLAFRRREGRGDVDEESEGEVFCVCGGGDDGRPLVQCDDCRTWYHLRCVGIKHHSELGAEEDPWYCPDCLGVGSSDPPSEPTFVPTDDKLPADGRRDPLFYQGGLQASPSTPWSSSRDPITPVRGRDTSQTFASRSSWGDSSGAGPSTPISSSQNVRVYTTPGPFDNFDHFDSPFDPTKTPSRGAKSGAAFTTPKNSLWSSRPGEQVRTPTYLSSNPWRTSGGPLPFSNNFLPGSPYRSIYSHDDTPIRRSVPKEHSGNVWGRQLWDSPLSPRSVSALQSSVSDSAMDSNGRS